MFLQCIEWLRFPSSAGQNSISHPKHLVCVYTKNLRSSIHWDPFSWFSRSAACRTSWWHFLQIAGSVRSRNQTWGGVMLFVAEGLDMVLERSAKMFNINWHCCACNITFEKIQHLHRGLYIWRSWHSVTTIETKPDYVVAAIDVWFLRFAHIACHTSGIIFQPRSVMTVLNRLLFECSIFPTQTGRLGTLSAPQKSID